MSTRQHKSKSDTVPAGVPPKGANGRAAKNPLTATPAPGRCMSVGEALDDSLKQHEKALRELAK